MVSERCKAYVQNELLKLGIAYNSVQLGEVELKTELSPEMIHKMDVALRMAGLEIMESRNSVMIEKLMAVIHQLIYSSDDFQKLSISSYIRKELNSDYSRLSRLFYTRKGITIEKYIISKKIERIKELLILNKVKLSDIAFQLQYSSASHLSTQFKKSTGISPSIFKEQSIQHRPSMSNMIII